MRSFLRGSLYNNVLSPTKLAIGSNYHLFKEGIRPMWEDPINAKGGKWIFTNARSRKARLDECWLHVVRLPAKMPLTCHNGLV